MKPRYSIHHLIYTALAVITFAAYEPILHNGFVNFDDDLYIYNNPKITSGLKFENITWAFTHIHANNYHPLTSISHMLDCQLFGTMPAGHHLVNLLFHIANTALLCFILSRMTGRLWAAAFVAALFALHPMHVESVAWASERKDVLCTFFWLLTMLAYWRYVQKPNVPRYVLTAILFVLGLLSKPMAVTLPFVLLLADFWPLGRLGKSNIHKLIVEKVPFFMLSVVVSIITIIVQNKTGLVKPMEEYSLPWRLENAIVSYIIYIRKMFWPFNLAVFYPHPKGTISLFETLGAITVLAAVTIFAFRQRTRRPYLVTGWLWFVGTLVPVIGLCQVGMQAYADRYTYIPYIGLFIALTWLTAENVNVKPIWLSIFAGILLLAAGIKTYVQTIFWQNNLTLYSHAATVTENNWWAYWFLGEELSVRGQYDEAGKMLEKSLKIYPDNANAYYEYAKISMLKNDWKTAIKMYEKLLPPLPDDLSAPRNVDRSKFNYPLIRNLYVNSNVNLALAYVNEGKYFEAQKRYREALRVEPDLPQAKKALEDLEALMKKSTDANSH